MIYSRASHKTIYLQDVPKNGLFDTECHKIFKLQDISKLKKWQNQISLSLSVTLHSLFIIYSHNIQHIIQSVKISHIVKDITK